MKKAYNFNAGPCVLPKPAIEAAIEALKDFKGTGMSVIEVSHRSKEWEAVMNECRALWKELLNIPDGYSVLFLGGGASLQFLYVAMNLTTKQIAEITKQSPHSIDIARFRLRNKLGINDRTVSLQSFLSKYNH